MPKFTTRPIEVGPWASNISDIRERLKYVAEILFCNTHTTNTGFGELAIDASITIIDLNVVVGFS